MTLNLNVLRYGHIYFCHQMVQRTCVYIDKGLISDFVNSVLFHSILYKTKLPFIVVMNKVRSLTACCCATIPLTS